MNFQRNKAKKNKTNQNKTKEKTKQNKTEQTSIVYHKHYCYRGFFSRFAVRLLSKIVVIICRTYNHS